MNRYIHTAVGTHYRLICHGIHSYNISYKKLRRSRYYYFCICSPQLQYIQTCFREKKNRFETYLPIKTNRFKSIFGVFRSCRIRSFARSTGGRPLFSAELNIFGRSQKRKRNCYDYKRCQLFINQALNLAKYTRKSKIEKLQINDDVACRRCQRHITVTLTVSN